MREPAKFKGDGTLLQKKELGHYCGDMTLLKKRRALPRKETKHYCRERRRNITAEKGDETLLQSKEAKHYCREKGDET
jgi:hypothetical protein